MPATPTPSMPVVSLGELTRGFADVAPEFAELAITGLVVDSRLASPGSLYVALRGQRAHGAEFARAAGEAGAVAVLTDPEGADIVGTQLPVVVVADPRRTMADLAARLHGAPSARLQMFGITGTNGKTTTTFLLEAALAAAGGHVGTIGTIGFRLAGQPVEVARTTVTTPESVDLQALLARFADAGADQVVMEVSSHALALERVHAVQFDVAGFTNLGRDHLDFHHTLDEYFEAKARLFDSEGLRHAVVMTTDDRGRELARRLRQRTDLAPTDLAPTVLALTTVGEAADDDVRLLSIEAAEGGGTRVQLTGALGDHDFVLDLPGAHNGRNAALALAMAAAAGVEPDVAVAGLRHAAVPGRMQRVALSSTYRQPPAVFVDFAHTPQAVAEAVRVGRQFSRTAVVIGAGGDRDRAKRPAMGEAAALGAELVVVTDDNPRTEDPAQIREAVAAGARGASSVVDGDCVVELVGDRSDAIERALRWASAGDAVLVLGKGHEVGQIVGDQVHAHDDVQVVTERWGRLDQAATHHTREGDQR